MVIRRCIALLLVLSLLHASLPYPLRAQEGGEVPPPEEVLPPDAPEAVTDATEEPSEAVAGPATPSPEGQSFTGAASYRVPIAVPPGRGGIAPNLALTYSSLGRNGWVGVGWGLDLGAIQRSTKRGLDYQANRFVAVMQGASTELVARTAAWGESHYGAKVEGLFMNYFLNPATGGWEVKTKEGTTYYYGTTEASRLPGPDPGTVFRWALDRVEDLQGNFMTVSYWRDPEGGELYPERIDYTGNGALSPTKAVRFTLEERLGTVSADAPILYAHHAPLQIRYRLRAITVEASGALVRRYELAYSPSARTGRSLLSAITQVGADGTSTLPPQTFRWTQGERRFDSDAVWGTRRFGYANALEWGNVRLADVNGDARADLVYETSNRQFRLLLSHGTGFDPDRPAGTRVNGYKDGKTGFKMADVNGDGRADIVYASEELNGDLRVLLSTGEGFAEDLPWGARASDTPRSFSLADVNGDGRADALSAKANPALPYQDYDLRVLLGGATGFGVEQSWGRAHAPHLASGPIDVNGDGRADLVRARDAWADTPESTPEFRDIRVLLSSGASFREEADWGTFECLPGIWVGGTTPAIPQCNPTVRGADFNGDGLTDLYYDYIGGQESVDFLLFKLSTGRGFLPSQATPLWEHPPTMVGDVNGDGLADLVTRQREDPHKIEVYLSTGAALGAKEYWGIRTDDLLDYEQRALWLADVDGDGLAELGYDASCGSGCYEVRVLDPSGPMPDLLERIDTGYGGAYTLAYTPSSAYANRLLPYVLPTLSALTVEDGNGTTATTTYRYAGGWHSPSEREFRGFETATQTLPDGTTVTTRFHQGDPDRGETPGMKGLPAEVTLTGPELYKRVQTTYTGYAPYPNTEFPTREVQVDEALYEGAAEPRTLRTITRSEPLYGNPVKRSSLGDLAVTGDERFDYTQYLEDTALWVLALPVRQYTRGPDDQAILAETTLTYHPGTALPATRTQVGEGDPTTRFAYDPYGNLARVTDPRGYRTDYEHDATETQVTRTRSQVSASLTLETQATWSPAFGVPLTRTDANGKVTRLSYDAFGRRTMVTGPLDTASTYGTISWFYPGAGVVGQQRVLTRTTTEHGTDRHLWQAVYFDGLGRVFKTRALAPEGQVVVTTTRYDARGRVSTRSLPFFEAGGVEYRVTTSYDGLNRVTAVVEPNGATTTTSIKRDHTTLIDANGHRRVVTPDAYGRLVMVREYTGEDPYSLYATTTYRYDPLGNLTEVVDASGHTTTILYDRLARKVAMEDPDMGAWSYTYDASGNLTAQIDAKGQATTFDYDGLNRMTARQTPEGVTTYLYDQYAGGGTQNVRGRLAQVDDPSGFTRTLYDELGRVSRVVRGIEGKNYVTDRSVDALGRVTRLSYPAVGGGLRGGDHDLRGGEPQAGELGGRGGRLLKLHRLRTAPDHGLRQWGDHDHHLRPPDPAAQERGDQRDGTDRVPHLHV